MAHIIFQRLQFVMGAMALAILAVLQLPAAGAQPKPNLLFILTDQQHANMLSCAGNPWLKTPAMDSLAANGIRFQRAYSVNPVCVPARVGMFTGHTPSRFGIQSNKEMQETKIPAPIQAQTMGCLLRDAGYETAYGGKTHLPGNVEKYGFTVLTRDQRDELVTTCADFLKKKHDKPFLLVASLINPHDICYMAINAFAASQARKKTGPAGPHQQCLAEALQKPAGISEEEFFSRLCPPAPANLEPQSGAPEAIGDASYLGFRGYAFTNWTEKDWRMHRWAYARLTERVDREIEVILQALRATGLETNTVILFTSDHGDHDGSHRLEHKSTFYEEAANVPFIISQKGVTRANVVDREHLIAAHLDLIPTLCDYAGIPAPQGLKGRSLRALAEGGPVPEWRHYVVSETHFGRMVCSGHYKYCVYDRGEHREQLVDLQQDPGEMKNLARQPEFQAILTQHRQYLQEWVVSNQDSFAVKYLVNWQ